MNCAGQTLYVDPVLISELCCMAIENLPQPQPYALCSSSTLPEVSVPYSEVRVPSVAEVSRHLRELQTIEAQTGPINLTPLVDFAFRCTCLAYRRNAPTSGQVLALRDAPDAPPHGVELQFRTEAGAHAVCYLFHEPSVFSGVNALGADRAGDGSERRDGARLLAVLSFKGSTLQRSSKSAAC